MNNRIFKLSLIMGLSVSVTSQVVASDGGTVSAGAVAGRAYNHTIAASRFDVGANPTSIVDGPYVKMVGSLGVFGQHSVTGATLAVRDAPKSRGRSDAGSTSSATARGFTEDPDESNRSIRAYFVGAGLPDDEVVGVHVTTTLTMGVGDDGKPNPGRLAFLWYTSNLERSVSGIPVENSYAYAAFDATGRSITEGVFWPAIPADVVGKAVALKASLESADFRSKFLQSLSAQSRQDAAGSGQVKIVHTGNGWSGEFQAAAVFTFNTGARKPHAVRLDAATGQRITLPDELAAERQSDTASKQ